MPLEAKKIASTAPMVSTSPRAVVEHVVDLLGERRRHLLRPGLQQNLRDLVGEIRWSRNSRRQRRHHDQEREQRHQRRQRDVARDRPAVIGVEAIERIQCDTMAKAQCPHGVLAAATTKLEIADYRAVGKGSAQPSPATSRSRLTSASSAAMRPFASVISASTSAASNRCGMCCSQFWFQAETVNRIACSGRAL